MTTPLRHLVDAIRTDLRDPDEDARSARTEDRLRDALKNATQRVPTADEEDPPALNSDQLVRSLERALGITTTQED